MSTPRSQRLPSSVRGLFWDIDAGALRWERDRDLIIGRILSSGSWDVVRWLRQRAGDPALRDWIERHDGRGLSPQQLRFWQLILDIPERQVSGWLARAQRQVWDRRTHP